MTVEVGPYTGSAAEWDEFVRAQTGWTSFHLHAWKPIMERVSGHECPFLAARDAAGLLTGVLPLVRVKSAVFGHFLVSMPFVNYGGPLGGEDSVRALVEAAVRLAETGGAGLLELRSKIPLPVELPVSHRKLTVILDLPAGGPEPLRKHLGAKLRSQIKKPEKEGVTIEFGRSQVDPFYAVFSRHMRDLGTPTQPRALFSELADAFGEEMWIGCAWYQGQPIACGAGFRFGDEFEMTWASALVSHNRLAPNMLLYWAFMARAAELGLSRFNFGRCSPDSGTHRFKRQWGSQDEALWWYQRSATADAKTPSPDDGAYAWGPCIWRHLPLPLATALGPRIVRFIP